jgi:hypothetical protein
MNRVSLFALALAGLLLTALLFAQRAPAPRTLRASEPIVVELFTSEGCSSCPPADALLQKFDRQPYPGVQLIVLSEHVDYWNHIGWRDPYSDAAFSERQSAYGKKLGLDSVYTPQMVVDGTRQFVGSSSEDAEAAFEKASSRIKVPLKISDVRIEGMFLKAHVAAAVLPGSVRAADVILAIALDHAESQVAGGENSGRHLTHVSVARRVSNVGSIVSGEAFSKEVQIHLEPGTDRSRLRVIAFLQEPGPGRIVAAAEERIR